MEPESLGELRQALGRRRFLRLAVAAGLGACAAGCRGQSAPGQPTELPPAPTQASPVQTVGGVLPSTRASDEPDRTTREPGRTAVADEVPRSEPEAVAGEDALAPGPSVAYLAVARGGEARTMVRAALAALGGMERFVKPGHDVIVKPNICVDYHSYEYAATTNPVVVATLVELCLAAGAKRVRVMDTPFSGTPANAYARSGIGEAVARAGGQMEVMNPAKYREADIPAGREVRRWPVFQDILTADVVIDVPIAKHHSLARLTLGGKNLLGVIQNPGLMHANLGQRIADLVSLVRPTLTVVDAVRTLVAHGPSGGSLDDVRLTNTVIASHDIVAADAYAATLFGLSGADIGYVRAAAEMGLGTLDLSSIQIRELAV